MEKRSSTFKHLLLCLLAVLVYPLDTNSQIREYVTSHTTPINSADMKDTSYDDLAPFAKAIGDKRVVMLGELHHGDGEAIKLKSRIVRFLHEKMGFNVLVLEADFFALNAGYEAVEQRRLSFDSLIYLSVYPVWTKCQQMHELFGYIRNTSAGKQKLVVSGMDNRGISGYGIRHLSGAVDSFLRKSRIPFVNDPAYGYFIEMLSRASALLHGKYKPDVDSMMQMLPIAIRQLSRNEGKMANEENDFYLHVLKGLMECFHLSLHYHYTDEYKRTGKHHPLHDSQMAENLKWLVTTKYPKDKIIIWAHNTHIEKAHFKNLSYRNYHSMGYWFTQDKHMLSQTYIIGLTNYTGTVQLTVRDAAEKIAKPRKKSLESWIHSKGYQYAFTDISRTGNDAPFYMKEHVGVQSRQNWTTFFDGILYIENAQPCIKKQLIIN